MNYRIENKFPLLMLLFSLALYTNGNAQANKIEFEQETLPNGLHVIYNIDRSAPVVSTVVHYKVGSKDEDPNMTGYAHFFEHLMFEATEEYESDKIDYFVNSAGGNLNAHTSFDETVYKFTVPANQIKLALWIEASRMRNLKIDDKGVTTQKGVVKEERNVRVDNQPYGDLLERMAGAMWPSSGYSWPTIGFHEHLDKATIQNFQDFYDKYYHPNNACLVISGDFNLTEARQYVRDYFGNIPMGPEIKRPKFKVSEIKEEIKEEIIDEKAQLPALFIGFRGPKVGTKDYYAMELLNYILSVGESSRMYQELVDKQQIAVQTASMSLSLEKSGAVLFIGVPNLETEPSKLRKEIFRLIEEVADNGVKEEELEKAKNIKEASMVPANKNTLSKAMTLARYWAYYNDPGKINTEIDNYLNVTVDDIKSVAKKYFDTDKRVILTYLPKEN